MIARSRTSLNRTTDFAIAIFSVFSIAARAQVPEKFLLKEVSAAGDVSKLNLEAQMELTAKIVVEGETDGVLAQLHPQGRFHPIGGIEDVLPS